MERDEREEMRKRGREPTLSCVHVCVCVCVCAVCGIEHAY